MPHNQVLELATLPNVPGAYVLGLYAKRLTFYSQQARAINLVDAIHHYRTSLKGRSVAVVGAGAAGVTASVRALEYGARVRLFEKAPEILSIQKPGRHRWLHPSIYDWPFSALNATDDDARLPVMTWSASNADALALKLNETVDRTARSSRGAFRISPSTEITKVATEPSGKILLGWSKIADGKEDHEPFDLVILAVGFGLEPYNFRQNSYWEGDPIDNTARDSGILIVGYGDGALTDLMRACVVGFRHETVLKEVIRLASGSEVLDVIRSIEMHPRSSQDSWLTKNYLDLEILSLREYLGEMVNPNRKVVLAGPGPHLLSARACALNRLVVAQLLSLGAFHHVAFDEKIKIDGEDPEDATLAWVQKEARALTGERAKQVYLRFGAVAVIDKIAGIEKKDRIDLKSRWDAVSVSEDLTRQRLWESPFARVSRPERNCILFNYDSGDGLVTVARNAIGQLRLPNIEVLPVEVSQCFASRASLLDTVRALCAAPFVIFALGPEMGARNLGGMLLLGIRSAVRRGVTLVVHDQELKPSDWANLPFDLKELQVLGLPSSVESAEILADSLASAMAILKGDASAYNDLPVFDIVRRTQRRTPALKADRTEVFTLCSFSPAHEANLWNRLKLLLERVQRFQDGTLSLQRVIDYSSPLLVADRLYELIRFAGLCIADWSEWRPNVFFELGVRLAVHRIPPICVIQETDLDALEQLPEAIRRLVDIFHPIPYPVSDVHKKGDAFERSFEAELERRVALEPPSDTIYSAAQRNVSPAQERGAVAAHEALWQEARRILGGDVVRAGRIPVLYSEAASISEQALGAAIETLWSSWLLVQDQAGTLDIESDEERKRKDAEERLESLLDDLLQLTTSKRFDPLRKRIGAAPSTAGSFSSQVIRTAEKLQRDARRARKKKNELGRAETALREAVALLTGELKKLEADTVDRSEIAAGEQVRNVGALLADSYGSLAGVLRRKGDDTGARANYLLGMKLEREDRYRVTSTYNSVQWLVLSVLLNRNALGEDREVQSTLADTVAVLKRQTVTTRRDDPWALADLGLLATLAEDETLAREAFRSMNSLKPVVDLYASGMPVIQRLADVLGNPPGLQRAADWYAAGMAR